MSEDGLHREALTMACYAIRDNRSEGDFPICVDDLKAAIAAYLEHSKIEDEAAIRGHAAGYAACQRDVVAWLRAESLKGESAITGIERGEHEPKREM